LPRNLYPSSSAWFPKKSCEKCAIEPPGVAKKSIDRDRVSEDCRRIQSSRRRNRSALLMTDTEWNVMAAAAIIGLSKRPKNDTGSSRNRDPERIVKKGEEQVLADIFHVLRLSRRARAMPRRSPRTSVTPALCMAMWCRYPLQCPHGPEPTRSIVYAVTGHGDNPTVSLQLPDDLPFLVGRLVPSPRRFSICARHPQPQP